MLPEMAKHLFGKTMEQNWQEILAYGGLPGLTVGSTLMVSLLGSVLNIVSYSCILEVTGMFIQNDHLLHTHVHVVITHYVKVRAK